MQGFKTSNGFTILRGTKVAEPKYRHELSALIKEKFGTGPFSKETVNNILFFSQAYYVGKFEAICREETSYTFYKGVVWLHEQAVWVRLTDDFHQLPRGLDKSYIAEYRRVLKMIIEEGCLIEMKSGERKDSFFSKRFVSRLNDLLFLGQMMYGTAQSVAEQIMIGDAHDIIFDDKGLYIFIHRHHYDAVFEGIQKQQELGSPEYIMDQNGEENFKQAVNDCFGINYDKVLGMFGFLYEQYGEELGVVLDPYAGSFVQTIAEIAEIPIDGLRTFFSGMTLSRKNKLPLSELLKRPQSLDRYLYRPLLLWSIDGKEVFVFSEKSWFEATSQLYMDAIPWGKFPSDWHSNKCFTTYVNLKKEEHDAWLDDIVEQQLLLSKVLSHRNLKGLTTNSGYVSITRKDLGEIDFLIVCPAIKKILVAECKHLMGRYDTVNWKNDYYHFVGNGNGNSYNEKLSRKVNWIASNMFLVEEHFRMKYTMPELSLENYIVEGVFFINTPTFYMYNSEFRIYTYEQVRDVVTGQHVDPVITYRDPNNNIFGIRHPYFKRILLSG